MTDAHATDNGSSSDAPAPALARSYLDDIDGDDGPAVSPATASNQTRSAPSGVDDIDGDDAPTTQSTATVAAAAASTPATREIDRILSVLASDATIASIFNSGAPTAATAAAFGAPTAQADHFAILGLAHPEVTLTGEPVWNVDDESVKKSFRRLVVLIHPDKTPGEGAKAAFEAVKTAHTILSSDTLRYDYIKAYTAFRKQLAMRDPSFMPPSVVAATLEQTLDQGKKLLDAKKKQMDAFTARLHAQSEAKRQAILQGDIMRRKKDEQRRAEELKRKVMGSDDEKDASSSESEAEELSVAEKIRRAKQGQGSKKKIRML